MPSDDHVFLFASLDSKPPLTTRKVHIRRLYDILQLSIQRQDFERAKRVWAILVHCKEIDWKALWTMGLLILERDSSESNEKNEVEFLRTIMLQYPDDVRFNLLELKQALIIARLQRESILKELVFRLLRAGRCREALDELEL